MKRRTGLLLAGSALIVLLICIPYARAVLFIVRVAASSPWATRLARLDTYAYDETAAQIAWRGGSLRVRVYRPSTIRRAVLLVHGINAVGIDEPRIVLFARELAASGLLVVTPEMPDLERYAITARSTDMIEDAAAWLAGARDLAPDGRIGLIGISFSGGLSIVAGGRPGLRDRLAFIFAFGGHGDYPRVLRYLCTGVDPAAGNEALPPAARTPHDYGVAIILLGLADRLVPAEQAQPLRDGILTFLRASQLDMFDKPRAQLEFARAAAQADALREPAATLMRHVNTRNVASLGPRLLPLVDGLGEDAALSPERSPAPKAPVFLLHGADDNVIPAVETRAIAKYLEGKTRVRLLVSDVLTHAGVDRTRLMAEAWRVASFWTEMMRQ
jgi:dienelactone hydrolase